MITSKIKLDLDQTSNACVNSTSHVQDQEAFKESCAPHHVFVAVISYCASVHDLISAGCQVASQPV
jgi:hypothetical protein